ncbi:hypothetical protein SAMN04515617_116101 [Collimonas sp. OK242]|uniref:hypothetical protein n=1 Tax=Collimonas sp. OK242 TaxID=1798195 RepID=UPI00089A1E98|nr:hypothetical protein [Collimonas sp. OK242]SDY56446.1 hypothetical protein SAMN04515617_116101 [Collimonas sp. OK242]
MDQKIRDLLGQITLLEDKLRTLLQEKESKLFYQVNGKRVEFTGAIRASHRRLKINVFRWIARDRPQNVFMAPIIYSVILPLLFLDLCITIYQATCFPVYRIAKVRRAGYIVIDRQHLEYLNVFERFHCTYCAYANGLLAYSCEIAARTEQYFCPIKHARKILGSHARYARFLDYGDADDYHAELEAFRTSLAGEDKQNGESGSRN